MDIEIFFLEDDDFIDILTPDLINVDKDINKNIKYHSNISIVNKINTSNNNINNSKEIKD